MTTDQRITQLQATVEDAGAQMGRALDAADELRALRGARAAEQALEIATNNLRLWVEDAEAKAEAAERRAVELRARAEELEPAAEDVQRVEAELAQAQERLAFLDAALELAVIEVQPEMALRRIEEHQLGVRKQIAEHETLLATFADQASAVESSRAEAVEAAEEARSAWEDADNARAQIEVLPDIARRMAVEAYKTRRRLLAAPTPPKPEPIHALVPIGNGLLRDAADGRIYDGRGVPIIEPAG